MPIVVTDLMELSPIELAALSDGMWQLHILCRFRYIDVFDTPHEVKSFYTLNIKDRGLYLRNNYGSMD